MTDPREEALRLVGEAAVIALEDANIAFVWRDAPRLLTVTDLARFCDVAPKTVRKWVETGALRAVKLPGGHQRFERAEAKQFMERCGYIVPGEL